MTSKIWLLQKYDCGLKDYLTVYFTDDETEARQFCKESNEYLLRGKRVPQWRHSEVSRVVLYKKK